MLDCLRFLYETYLLVAFISSIWINFSIALFSSKMSSGLGRTLNSWGSSSVRLPSYSSLNLISVFALTLALPIFCNLRVLNFSTRCEAFNSPNGNLYSLSIWFGAFFRSSFWFFSPSTNFFNDEQELELKRLDSLSDSRKESSSGSFFSCDSFVLYLRLGFVYLLTISCDGQSRYLFSFFSFFNFF